MNVLSLYIVCQIIITISCIDDSNSLIHMIDMVKMYMGWRKKGIKVNPCIISRHQYLIHLLGFWQTEYDLSGTGFCRVPKHKIEPYILYILKKWYTLEWIIKRGRTFIFLIRFFSSTVIVSLLFRKEKGLIYIFALSLKKTLYDISFVLGFSVASCKQTLCSFPYLLTYCMA